MIPSLLGQYIPDNIGEQGEEKMCVSRMVLLRSGHVSCCLGIEIGLAHFELSLFPSPSQSFCQNPAAGAV